MRRTTIAVMIIKFSHRMLGMATMVMASASGGHASEGVSSEGLSFSGV